MAQPTDDFLPTPPRFSKFLLPPFTKQVQNEFGSTTHVWLPSRIWSATITQKAKSDCNSTRAEINHVTSLWDYTGKTQSVLIQVKLAHEFLLRKIDKRTIWKEHFSNSARMIFERTSTTLCKTILHWVTLLYLTLSPHSFQHGETPKEFVLKGFSLPELKDKGQWMNDLLVQLCTERNVTHCTSQSKRRSRAIF